MADGVSPFVYKPVDCPICNEAHDQPHFRLRMFAEGERESDGHILHYKWLNDRVKPINPAYYYLYHCPHCYFTDVTTEFKNPRENQFHPLVERAYSRLTDRDKEILIFLNRNLNYGDIRFRDALSLHYLAAYVQLLLPDDAQDDLKIGRLLLRIAWLFREQGPAQGEEVKNPMRRDTVAALETYDGHLQQLFHQWQKAGQVLAVQMDAADRETAPGAINPYRHHRERIEKLLEAQVSELYRLKELCRTGVEIEGAGTGTTQEFLASVKSLWPFAPANEVEAMRMAIGYLEKAVSRDATFDDPQAHLNGISLLIDLMIRCEDFDAAFTMIRGIYRNATYARGTMQETLRNPELDETAKQKVRNKIRGLSRSVEHAGELRRKLLGILIDRDRATIRRVLSENAGAPVEQVASALEQHGISPGVVVFLKERGDLDPKKNR
ncbi:MAG: DUF2225 domain-containing protein [Candidatus Hydrogenedentes bacterium]|nr:DUF2225 domain-containing protein [Candidatus Hydrogenedentota bacterium]